MERAAPWGAVVSARTIAFAACLASGCAACGLLGPAEKAVQSLPPADVACVLDGADRGVAAEAIVIECHLAPDALAVVQTLIDASEKSKKLHAARVRRESIEWLRANVCGDAGTE